MDPKRRPLRVGLQPTKTATRKRAPYKKIAQSILVPTGNAHFNRRGAMRWAKGAARIHDTGFETRAYPNTTLPRSSNPGSRITRSDPFGHRHKRTPYNTPRADALHWAHAYT